MKTPLIPATFAARATIWLTGGYAVWQGAGIALGGAQRFAGPSFEVLRSAPHPTLFWGWWMVTAGALLLTGSILQLASDKAAQIVGLVLKSVGLIAIAIWSFTFAAGAFDAAAAIATVPTTGGRTYAYIGCVAIVLLSIDERRPRRDV